MRLDRKEFGDWCQSRVYDVMDGFLVAFLLGVMAFLAALAAGAVIFALGISWELLNPEVARTGHHPEIIDLVGIGVFALVWCGSVGHAFTSIGMKGFERT